jgi:hypothetical protein
MFSNLETKKNIEKGPVESNLYDYIYQTIQIGNITHKLRENETCIGIIGNYLFTENKNIYEFDKRIIKYFVDNNGLTETLKSDKLNFYDQIYIIGKNKYKIIRIINDENAVMKCELLDINLECVYSYIPNNNYTLDLAWNEYKDQLAIASKNPHNNEIGEILYGKINDTSSFEIINLTVGNVDYSALQIGDNSELYFSYTEEDRKTNKIVKLSASGNIIWSVDISFKVGKIILVPESNVLICKSFFSKLATIDIDRGNSDAPKVNEVWSSQNHKILSNNKIFRSQIVKIINNRIYLVDYTQYFDKVKEGLYSNPHLFEINLKEELINDYILSNQVDINSINVISINKGKNYMIQIDNLIYTYEIR